MKFYSRFAAGVFVLCAVLFLSGCASPILSFLARDNLEKDQGLIMVRVRIKDHTGALVYHHRSLGILASSTPSLIVQKEGERDTNDEAWIFLDKKKYYFSKEEDGTFYFDQYYYIAAGSGRYFINYLNLHLDERVDAVYGGGTRTTSTYLNVPLYAVVDLKNNGLASVGLIDFELNSIHTDKHTQRLSFNYTMRLDDSQDQTAHILSHFRTNYPISSQKFTDQQPIETAFFGVYVNFNKYVSSSSQHFSRWNEHYSKICKITANSKDALLMDSQEPKKTGFSYATIQDSLALPNSYAINYQMRWYDGMKDAAYGFNIVQNDKNQYFFGATAAGTPTVWIKKDGQWLADPETNKVSRFLSSPKQADDFKIEYKEGVFTYRINDEVAATVKDLLSNNKTKVGFFVAGTQKVKVDFVTIVGR